jgi:hypothetical protein
LLHSHAIVPVHFAALVFAAQALIRAGIGLLSATSQTAETLGTILNGRGHAVYAATGPKLKDTTAGTANTLLFNSPAPGSSPGW